jgi:Uma2 family endonuclease
MSTVALKLGPKDHGRPLTYDDYMEAEYEGGYRYELIQGRLYVSPAPNPQHDDAELWLFRKLLKYADENPTRMNKVTNKAEVWVRRGKKPTLPLPDITGFRNYPRERPPGLRWYDLEPILVVEIMAKGSVKKDLNRNVKLYRRVPSVREYWILDIREGDLKPSLMVFRRRLVGWLKKLIPFSGKYTTRLLPGFELIVDPHA